MRARPLVPRLLLVLAGTTLGLGVGEVALRLSGFREEMARRNTVIDPEYGTVRADSWVFDFHVEPGAREADLRGQRVPLPKPPGEVRVLFVGDSGTEGVLIPLDATYPLRFEERLAAQAPGSRVRAVNAGVFGMTPVDEVAFLESKLLALEPDVVVLGLFMANDINFTLAHTERRRTVEPRSPVGRDLVRRSALAHFLYLRTIAFNARHRWVRADELAAESGVAPELALIDAHGFHMLSYPMGETATYLREPSALVDRAFGAVEHVLWRLKRLGQQRGFEARVLIIPTPSTIAGRLTLLHYPDIWQDLREAGIEIGEEDLDFDAPTRRVLATCAELGLECFDPTARMREIGLGVFFEDDEHPNATGHAVLAEELVAERGRLLPSR